MNSASSPTGTETAAPIASFCPLSDNHGPTGRVDPEGQRRWYSIEGVEAMRPFLMSLVSDSDHWLFMLSSGALTAGRVNPDHALLPYYTQDKLQDMASASGSQTLLMVRENDREHLWEPFRPTWDRSSSISRRLSKNDLGNHIRLEEFHAQLGLLITISWRPSEHYGFVRRMELLNVSGESRHIRVLDGLRNLLPSGLGQRFQNEFSILGDAYKQAELDLESGLATYHLSSRPTDLAEPLEALLANVAWQAGLPAETVLLSEEGQEGFSKGIPLQTETALRGRRGAYLGIRHLELQPGADPTIWYTCADVDKDVVATEALAAELRAHGTAIVHRIEADCLATEQRLCQMLAAADGFQWTAAANRTLRHTSNTTFNLMRGGAFVTGYELPREDLLASVAHFNAEAATDLADALNGQQSVRVDDLWADGTPLSAMSKDAKRLVREYLPLTFSRRHGDPSRPWNRFSIEIKEPDGRPRFSYQGNWRDIFQNWEALLMSYPSYTEATILRFLNASTADGYNPYRLTKSGFEWEVLEPGDDWANIGYWGDHQIIYLLRLLETSRKFNPERLSGALLDQAGVYAQVPYRLRSFEDMLRNTRETVDYDHEWAARIESAVSQHGADGKLLRDAQGRILYVSLLEKLLVPLLGKLSNFIPGGGIWMNTQRPEWNDANNALVGNGISVVTTGYINRYLRFLIDLLESSELSTASLSEEVTTLLSRQVELFSSSDPDQNDGQRLAFMAAMGEAATTYRLHLYDKGLSGQQSAVSIERLLQWLRSALSHITHCLMENRRADGLWHSYNLLRIRDGEASVERLFEMLEGQVSIISAGVLSPSQAIDLLNALRKSALYRADQDSYVLYPDRTRPEFFSKNLVPAVRLQASGLADWLTRPDTGILRKRSNGDYAFNGNFRNVGDLRTAIAKHPHISAQDQQTLLDLFEASFNHHAFTGRSGTFFAYEGLGSIYWHMVSKLVLAVQELFPPTGDCPEALRDDLTAFFRSLRDGLGVNKAPGHYGAFPTDAYSHTPAHCGAQQPGMTGQVKEDILIRLRELGICVDNGEIYFVETLLEKEELFEEPQTVTFHDLIDGPSPLAIPANGLAFSFCQIPFVCSRNSLRGLQLHLRSGESISLDGYRIPAHLSQKIFQRTGEITRVAVNLSI
jgi:hypothetical protein